MLTYLKESYISDMVCDTGVYRFLSMVIERSGLLVWFLGSQEPNVKLNVIYGLECSQCAVEYVQESGKRLRARMRDHTGVVR